MAKSIVLFMSLLLAHCLVFAGSLEYSKLKIKDLDQMREMVQEFVDEAEVHIAEDETSEATQKFREAMKTILSRPNGDDNMVSELMRMIKGRMRDLNAYEDTIMGLAGEAIYALTEGKEKTNRKATNIIVLENILSEFQPEAKTNPEIKKVFEKIRDANIKVPKKVESELSMRIMYKVKMSPSKYAERIIGKRPEEK